MRFGTIYLHKPRFWQFILRCTMGSHVTNHSCKPGNKLCKELQGVHMPVIEQYQLLPVDHVITPE